jgi:cysteine desulfurase
VDLLAMSAHKLYGPKGVGALYVRGGADNVHLEPSSPGGGQEHGLRSGTLNVPAIVGLGKACEVAAAQLPADAARVLELRERLRLGLQAALPDVRLNGALAPRLPGNLNLGFAGVTGESLLMQLNDIAVSPGAACDNQNAAPSHVLRAIGVPDDLARSSIRFGLGRFNTVEEVDYVIGKVTTVVQRLRATSPQRTTRAEPEEVR